MYKCGTVNTKRLCLYFEIQDSSSTVEERGRKKIHAIFQPSFLQIKSTAPISKEKKKGRKKQKEEKKKNSNKIYI